MSNRTIELYLRDMLDSILAIEGYVAGKIYEDFAGDRMLFSATVREFEIIGEATGKLPEGLKEKYHHIGWRSIKNFRNLLAHEYFGIDTEIVWDAVQEELQELKQTTQEILAKGDFSF